MLTSPGTASRADVLSAYRANAYYRDDLSGEKCRAFIEAATILLTFPSHARSGAQVEADYDIRAVENQINQARTWLASHVPTSAGDLAQQAMPPRQFTFEKFRDNPGNLTW